jgi:hypothetical protein
MDHDRLFKRLLSEFFGEFLQLFVPDLAEALDDAELVPLDKELWQDDAPAAQQPVLRFEFRVVQLNRLHWEAFRDHPNAVAAALMARMRIAPEDRARVKWECYQMMAMLRLNPKRARRIVEFIEGYLRLDEQEQRMFVATYEASAPAVKEVVMEYSNQWVEIGQQWGLAAGRQQAALDLLQRLLTRRFGPLPEARREALAALPVETVEAIAESIFELTSLDDLERWLAPQA